MGDSNVFAGAETEMVGSNTNPLVNAIAIGTSVKVRSNQVRIGNANITLISGPVPFSSSSDIRLKEDLQPVNLGLDFICKLNPVSYHRISNEHPDREIGLIAQELLSLLEEFGADKQGMVSEDADGYYTVRYNDLIPILIKSIADLNEKVQSLSTESLH